MGILHASAFKLHFQAADTRKRLHQFLVDLHNPLGEPRCVRVVQTYFDRQVEVT